MAANPEDSAPRARNNDRTEPEERATMQCARHPQVETFVRCGKCDQPICPDCMVSGPVGVRCRECARQNLDAIMRGSPRQYLLGALGAVATALLLGCMPYALPWLGIIYGYVVAEATL